MTRQVPVYVTIDLDSDALVGMLPGRSEDNDVAITFGRLGNPESVTVHVEDPTVLDRLSDIAGQAAVVLRAKLATFDAEDLAGDGESIAGGVR